MTFLSVVLKTVDLGFAIAERVVARQERALAERRRLADLARWATEPAPHRACAVCAELVYTRRQTKCFKCGAALPFTSI